MATTPPATLSPGYLGMKYTQNGRPHLATLRLLHGVDLDDIPTLRTMANDWATAFTEFQCPDATAIGWVLLDTDRTRLYQEAYSAAYIGIHPRLWGSLGRFEATTVAFSGRGVGPSVHTTVGNTLTRFFTGASYQFTPATKYMSKDSDVGLSTMWDFLQTHLLGPADFYGQHTEMRILCPVDFNSFAENHWGE